MQLLSTRTSESSTTKKKVVSENLALITDPYLEAKANRWFVAARLKMRLFDDSEDEQTAESAASCCSGGSRHHRPADDDKHISRVEFPTAIYLLMKQNQSELIDFNFNLEPSVAKLVCVRTSSKEYPPTF